MCLPCLCTTFEDLDYHGSEISKCFSPGDLRKKKPHRFEPHLGVCLRRFLHVL